VFVQITLSYRQETGPEARVLFKRSGAAIIGESPPGLRPQDLLINLLEVRLGELVFSENGESAISEGLVRKKLRGGDE